MPSKPVGLNPGKKKGGELPLSTVWVTPERPCLEKTGGWGRKKKAERKKKSPSGRRRAAGVWVEVDLSKPDVILRGGGKTLTKRKEERKQQTVSRIETRDMLLL